jgi:hypothetical protein
MYADMQEVLDYNFNWFYTGFKQHIVEEMVYNFETCTGYHGIFDEAKTRLAR